MRYAAVFIILVSALLAAPLPLRFTGNTQIGDNDLYEALSLYKPSFLEIWEKKPAIDPIAIPQSVSALVSYYRSKGYYHARIIESQTDTLITFTIEENTPITIGTVTVNSPLNIGSAITLEENDRFDQEAFSESKAALKKRYGEAGYCNAQFNNKAWVDIETNKAYLLFEATPGEPCTFGAISVESTANIDGTLPASMLRFEEGDPYSLQAIKQSYETLYTQEAITRVIIHDSERNGSVVPITLNIEETDQPIRFSAGLGYSSDLGVTAQTGLKHRNFFGDLKSLSLNARYSPIKQNASGIFTLPLQNRTFLGAEVGYKNEKFDGYTSESTYEKITAKYQDYPLSAMAGVLFDRIQTYDSTDIATFPNTLLFITSPLGEINYDTRDKPLEPSKGYWLNAKLTGSLLSPVFSDATYFKSLLSGAYITSINDHVFGAKLKWGTLHVFDGEVPSSYRFYAGGMNSNRAYSYRDLGPKTGDGNPIGFMSLVEGSFEYRFPIYEEFRGVLFTDITFASPDFIPDYRNDGYLGVGAGLRYVTPIGPVAIDVGIDPANASQYAIHFRIGELF